MEVVNDTHLKKEFVKQTEIDAARSIVARLHVTRMTVNDTLTGITRYCRGPPSHVTVDTRQWHVAIQVFDATHQNVQFTFHGVLTDNGSLASESVIPLMRIYRKSIWHLDMFGRMAESCNVVECSRRVFKRHHYTAKYRNVIFQLIVTVYIFYVRLHKLLSKLLQICIMRI